MTQINHIAQPAHQTTLSRLEQVAQQDGINAMDVAAAYVTSSGARDLLKTLRCSMGNSWDGINKRWLTSFDYLRSEPIALQTLLRIPESEIRIYDAEFCLSHFGRPRIPFHPKAFLFRSLARDYALTGSGNVSRSGLSRGIEAGLVISVKRNGTAGEMARNSIQALQAWFLSHWQVATLLNEDLLSRYTTLYESTPNLKNPTPTEDDIASNDSSRGSLSSDDLQKLRVCRYFWIEAGNITRNRGPNLPGNQLMMRRLSRVYFGFTPDTLPENSPIGEIEIVFGEQMSDYSLTYSDNGMDKLILPIPGAAGPPAYDNRNLLFERISPTRFRLLLGDDGQKARWTKKSKLIDADFRMSSGRQWGVF